VGFSKFTGEFDHTLDEKSRLIIPSKFRKPLGERFYFLRGINAECIWVMPEEDFEAMMEKFDSKIPITDTKGQNWLRSIHASAYLAEMDKQGRVSVPQKLRDWAEVKDPTVTLVGTRNQIEIWSTEKWQARYKEEDFLEQTSQLYSKYGL
jgi:MraZ protein